MRLIRASLVLVNLNPINDTCMAIFTTGGGNDIVKAKSSGEDPRATGDLVSNLPHPRVNKTKRHDLFACLFLFLQI